eukprot:TRINITY_DN5335_c0_g1_i15.p1 TRINITY_DN5335_c0_g1~~TRINITY_DN5335_c0_g1_i15.p1  ORF type:complete len:385 (+),score=54.48 TRINITY_DN5335_c0_g1_i15:156-1310(+)
MLLNPGTNYSPSIGPPSLTATLVNALLSTAPFSLPYALVNGGLVLGLLLFLLASFLALNSADMMIESLGVASALQSSENYKCEFRNSKQDLKIKHSPFFIKKKLELFGLSTLLVSKAFGVLTVLFTTAFLIGSMLLKCVSSCESLSKALMFAIYGDMEYDPASWVIRPYYVAVIVFALVCTTFALGNIEGSKVLQIFIVVLRFLMIYWMILGSIYSIARYGMADMSKVKLFDVSNIGYVMTNVIFTTFIHHSVPGMVYPLRPQTKLKNTFINSYVFHAIILLLHCILGVFAFGDRTNECNQFPCKVKDIFNLTFMSLPVVGPTVQFFPALAIAVFPVLAITLRSNILQVLGKSTTAVRCELSCRLPCVLFRRFCGHCWCLCPCM